MVSPPLSTIRIELGGGGTGGGGGGGATACFRFAVGRSEVDAAVDFFLRLLLADTLGARRRFFVDAAWAGDICLSL